MEYVLHVLVIAGIYVILAESLNLVVGFAGVPAMGHAAFSCIGAYTSALLALRFGVSPFVGMLAGALMGGLLGLGLARLILPGIASKAQGLLPASIPLQTWGVGLVLIVLIGLVVGVLPALRAKRLKIVDALAGR